MSDALEKEIRKLRSRVVALGELLDAQERTVVEQAALLEARTEEALSAARAKASFLANMSHEIRTPLNAVIGMTGLLIETPLSSDQAEFAQTIRTSGEHLLQVINDILDYSKIEAGGLEPEFISFDLRTCVEEAFDIIAGRAAEKQLDLAFLFDEGVPPGVVSDVGRLRQILVNLLGNAVKFTGDLGSVSVRVSGRPGTSPDKRLLTFSVEDTGIGIPKDRQEGLFKAFMQVDASTTRLYGGTGLGLAISQRLIELLGGRIWVESEVDVGSKFIFELELEPARTAVVVSVGRKRQLGGQRVLVVDDLTINLEILSQQLAAWDLDVVKCSSPGDALALLASDPMFDLAILDYQMPKMDGLTLSRKIHEVAECGRLPLVILSSGGALERAALREAGVRAALQKPAKPERLRKTIERILGQGPPSTGKMLRRQVIGGTQPSRSGRILLVEDNPTNQRVAVLMLRQLGYEADVAGNGLEALDALKMRPYDLVFMDVQMPEMDGLEATRRIRARELDGNERIPIVAMTAHALEGDADVCLAAGMDAYLAKPIRSEQLADILATMLPEPEPEPRSGQSRSHLEQEPGEDPIDAEAFGRLAALCQGNDAQLASLITDHLTNSQKLITAVRAGVTERDLNAVHRAAHSLKSSTAMFGALELSGSCAHLESSQEQDLDTLLKPFDVNCRRARAALFSRRDALE